MFLKNQGDRKQTDTHVKSLPMLPLRDIIVFPHMVVPLFVGRPKSISAIDEAMQSDKDILLVAQKNPKTHEPTPEDIFDVGTVGNILQMMRLPDGTVKVLVEGKYRARIQSYLPNESYFLCEIEPIAENDEITVETEALMRSVNSTFDTYVKLNRKIPPEILTSVAGIADPRELRTLSWRISQTSSCPTSRVSWKLRIPQSGSNNFSALCRAKSKFCRSRER